MKTFSVAVAVAVVLTFICVQQSSALPLAEVPEVEDPLSYDSAAAAYGDMSLDSWKMPYSNRHKRNAGGCRFCCNCCPNMRGCGVCCRF